MKVKQATNDARLTKLESPQLIRQRRQTDYGLPSGANGPNYGNAYLLIQHIPG